MDHVRKVGGMKRGACVLSLGLMFILGGCEGELTDAEYLQRAKAYQEQDQIRSSIVELKNALSVNPRNAEARYLLGILSLEAGDPVSAEKELGVALQLEIARAEVVVPLSEALLRQNKFEEVIRASADVPGLPAERASELALIRGDAFLGLGRIEEAVAAYDKVQEKYDQASRLAYGRARIALAKRDWEDAEKLLLLIVEQAPDFAPAWALLGELRRFNGEAAAAEEAFSQALRYRPKAEEVILNRALVRIYQGKDNAAEEDLMALNRLQDYHPGVPYARGLLAYKKGEWQRASRHFQEALVRDSRYMPAMLYLGMAYYKLRDFGKAEPHLRAYTSANPQAVEAGKLLASLQLYRGDQASAEALLKKVLERRPNDIEALNLMADVEMARGNRQANIELLEQVLELDPTSAENYMKLGMSALWAGHAERSVAAFDDAASIDQKVQPEAAVLRIVAYLRAGEFERAIEYAEQTNQRSPGNADVVTLLGGAYAAKGDVAAAEGFYRQALRIEPGHFSAAYNLAGLALREGDTESARDLFEQVVAHHPDNLRAVITLAQFEARNDRLQQAITYTEQALKTHPEAFQPRVMLANYALRIGNTGRVFALDRGLDPSQAGHPSWLAVLGEARLVSGEPESALATFDRLVAAVPESARAHYLLAKAHAAAGNSQRSRASLETAFKVNPAHLPTRLMMTYVLIKEGAFAEADTLLEEMEQTLPEHPKILTLRAQREMAMQKPLKAAEYLSRALAAAPSTQTQLLLAKALQQAGKLEESLASSRAWLETHPGDQWVLYDLGNSLMLLNRLDEAREVFSSVVELAPEHVLALNNLAWLLREDQQDLALRYAEKAYELAPEVPVVLDTLGVLLLDKGETGRAERLLESAAKKAPANPNIRYNLAVARAKNGKRAESRELLLELLAESEAFSRRQEAEVLLQSLGG